MEMNVGEQIDRLSILLHKVEKIGVECYSEFVEYARSIFLETDPSEAEVIIEYLQELYAINGEIWILEADLRAGNESKLGKNKEDQLKEIGRRAILIREQNKERVRIKNELVKLIGRGHPDIKKSHRSQ